MSAVRGNILCLGGCIDRKSDPFGLVLRFVTVKKPHVRCPRSSLENPELLIGSRPGRKLIFPVRRLAGFRVSAEKSPWRSHETNDTQGSTTACDSPSSVVSGRNRENSVPLHVAHLDQLGSEIGSRTSLLIESIKQDRSFGPARI